MTRPDATSPASQVGMEAPLGRNETDYSGLIERLERKRQVYNGRGTFRAESVNLDGKDAAKAIRDLEAENARLRSAPIPAVQSGAVAWGYKVSLAITEGPWTNSLVIERPEAEDLTTFQRNLALRLSKSWTVRLMRDGAAIVLTPRSLSAPQSELIEATRAHFEAWMQDEADDEGPAWTGCSIEEHESAKRVKEALAALSGKEQG